MTSILPLPEWQPLDNNGNILPAGQVFTYTPGTTDEKTTWQDSGETVENTNPVVLNSAGRAIIFGSGQYRIILKDSLGNQVYDQLSDSTLSEDTISAVMLPVVGAQTTTVARDLMGVTDAISSAITNISLLPGPTGPIGVQGVQGLTGPTGPAGITGSGALDVQVFISDGTWTKPAVGSTAIIQMWGPGGSGGAYSYGGGGNGGYVSITVALFQLPATVAVTIGAGGVGTAVPGAFGNPGGYTFFGPYLTMGSGQGGSFDGNNNILITGAPGRLLGVFGLTLLSGSYDTSGAYSGTDGVDIFSAPQASVFGGTGGTASANGADPGGGGGSSINPSATSGSGGRAQVIVSVF